MDDLLSLVGLMVFYPVFIIFSVVIVDLCKSFWKWILKWLK